MRTYSAATLAALADATVSFFYLIELELNNATYYFTTYPRDLVVGGQTYLGNGLVLDTSTPTQNTVVNRAAYTLTLADPNDELRTEIKQGIVGKNLRIRAGFATEAAGPLLDEADLIFAYRGYIDSPKTTNDFYSKVVVLEGSSPMSDLDLVKPYFTSKYGVSQFDPTDTCFDRISEGYAIQVRWGKI